MTGKFKFYVALLILGVFCKVNVNAQLPYLKHFTTVDGLPSSTIYGGIQDKEGFLWFGTDAGVTRFDGKTFTNFTLADGLSDNEILLVKQDSKGRIWFLGLNGTVSYYYKGTIYNSKMDLMLNEIKSTLSFVNIYEDKNKTIWFITSEAYFLLDTNNIVKKIGVETNKQLKKNILEGVVSDFHSGQLITTLYGQEPSIVKYSNGTFSIHKAEYSKFARSFAYYLDDGSVLFLSNEGLVHQKDTIQTLILPLLAVVLNDTKLVGIVLTKDNKLWLSLNGRGVFVYDYSDMKAEPEFINIKKPGYLVSDHEGNIWIGTMNEGLYMLPAWAKDTKLITSADGISEDHVFSVSKTENQDIFLGQSDGMTYILTGRVPVNSINPTSGLKYNRILNIICNNNDVWIASDDGVFHYNKESGCSHALTSEMRPSLPLGNIKDISLLSDGLYITTPVYLLKYNLPCPGKGAQQCQALNTGMKRYFSVHATGNGVIWYSNVNGLFSTSNDSIISHANTHDLFSNRINDILELPDSTIVLASYGYGLIFYKKGKITKHLKKSDGLASDLCRNLFIYQSTIYVATPEGVSIVQHDLDSIRVLKNFNTSNALPTNDVNDVYADEEEILIATSSGMVIVKQKSIAATEKSIPLLRLLSVNLENRELDKDSSYVFDYTQNSFQVKYIGIYYKSPDEVFYRYRLNDKDAWQLTQNTSIDILSLPHGTHSFQIQAKVKDGSWSPVEQFDFIIKPPFWKTNWFMAGFLLLAAILIVTVVQLRFRNLKKKHREKINREKQINRLEQQALQAMMNPHFIFNVMNSIQQFINSNDNHAANHYLSEFARLIRMNLHLTIKGLVSLEEEINYLELYLSLEKIRFQERFSYDIIIAPDIDDDETMIPPMMIQPFLENAIWHGILPLKGNGHVILSIERTENKLIRIQVIDNGVGILENTTEVKTDTHKSYGMALTRQRLDLIEKSCGRKLSIEVSKAYPGSEHPGTRVALLLPDRYS